MLIVAFFVLGMTYFQFLKMLETLSSFVAMDLSLFCYDITSLYLVATIFPVDNSSCP